MSMASEFRRPPSADDDVYIYIDHREEESSIVEYVSERLAPDDALAVGEDDEHMMVRYRDQDYLIPLQYSRHDRYIMISSLAELLGERYAFFVLEPSLGDDTHGLLVVKKSDLEGWPAVPAHLGALRLGYDYFNDIQVPYLHHENHAPDFAADRSKVDSSHAAMAGMMQSMFSGRMDEQTAAQFAKLAMTHPDTKEATAGKTEEEVAAELLADFNASMKSPEALGHRREMDEAMNALRSLTAPQPKPWWKFW